MRDYRDIIKQLERENEMTSTTEAQRECNQWRIKWLEMVNRPKHAETDYVRLNPIQERLKDSSYTLNPNKLLK